MENTRKEFYINLIYKFSIEILKIIQFKELKKNSINGIEAEFFLAYEANFSIEISKEILFDITDISQSLT